MKILWISHFLPWPVHGGSSQRNYNLMRELRKESTIYNIGFMQRPHHASEVEKYEAIERISELCGWLRAFDIPSDYDRLSWYFLLAANLTSYSPYSVWRFRSAAFEAELDSLLKRERFDIVYADTVATAHYALRAKGKSKLVLNHHNVESSLLFRRAAIASNRLLRRYLTHQAKKLRKWEEQVCPQFDVNLTVSELDAEELRSYAPEARYEVIANGTDTDYFTPSFGIAGHEMMYAGGGTWFPNRDAMSWFIREIFPIIVARVPDAVMHVIGTNPPEDVIEASRRDNRIRVHGFVPDIRPYLASAAVYVVPIRVGGGTRLKILDAFAAGKTVVSTSIGCEGIACEDGSNIRIADSKDTFAKTVVDLFENNSARQTLEVNARQLVERAYSWQIIGSRLRSLYRELAS